MSLPGLIPWCILNQGWLSCPRHDCYQGHLGGASTLLSLVSLMWSDITTGPSKLCGLSIYHVWHLGVFELPTWPTRTMDPTKWHMKIEQYSFSELNSCLLVTLTDDKLEQEITSPDFPSQVSKNSVTLYFTLILLGGFDRNKLEDQ